MSGNANHVPLAPQHQRIPGSYPRAPTPQQRADCYHSVGTGGYMSGGVAPPAPGMQQGAMRGPDMRPAATQSPVTTQNMPPQSELKQPPMNYLPNQQQNQQQQPRPQLYQPPYRSAASQRPTHRAPSHQQLYQGGAAATAPMMYAPLVYPPHVMQQYGSPQRPACYPQNVTHIIHQNYCLTAPYQQNQPPQQTFYYPTATPPLLSSNLTPPAQTGRNSGTLVAPPGTPGAPPPPSAAPSPIQHQPTHMHHTISAPPRQLNVQSSGPPIRKKRSYALPIKDPKTGEDVCAGMYSDNNQTLSGESSERQTPQPETNSVAEEFSRMVIETLNKNNTVEQINKLYFAKSEQTMGSILTSQSQLPSSNNTMSETIPPEVKTATETPVVSAMSDSPVIVPKLCPTAKPKVSDVSVGEVKKQKLKKSPVPDENKIEQSSMEKHMSAPSFVPAAAAAETSLQLPELDEPRPVPPALSELIESVELTPQPQRIKKETKNRKELSPLMIDHVEDNSTHRNGQVISTFSESSIMIVEQMDSEATVEIPQIRPDSIELTDPVERSLTPDETPVTDESTETSEPITPTAETPMSPVVVTDTPEDMEIEFTTTQAMLHQSLISCTKSKGDTDFLIDADNKTLILETETNVPEIQLKNDHNKNQLTSNDMNQNEPPEAVKEDTLIQSKTVDSKLSNKLISDYNNMPMETPMAESEITILSSMELKLLNKDEPDCKTEVKLAQIPKQDRPVLKYHYKKNQWSPINQTGKKMYDREFLLQLQEDPLSKRKPDNIHMLAAVMKVKSPECLIPLPNLSRINSEAFMPLFAKSMQLKGPSRDRERELKKNAVPVKSASMKATGTSGPMQSSGQSMGSSKNVIHVSLQLKGDVKLNEIENAWKPARRIQNSKLASPDEQTQEIYRRFRGILNKLTPENFSTLLEKVKMLQINTQERLEGVIDLVFEKAIDEPNFSVTYANMCNKLSKLMVLVDNSTDQYVNFRALIINKCQAQFETNKGQERVLELEKEISETSDVMKKKELSLLLDEENRKIRMRSVGNVRFIGELYKLGMLISSIMLHCLNNLIQKLEEEKLECLCKLLTTIGQLLEQKEKDALDEIFNSIQDIVEKKSDRISSRVRFMLQDVIALRRRKWAAKNVIDAQPKTMDQIQKEAEYQQRQIEIMNSAPMGRDYRGGRDGRDGRDEGGRGKRGGADGRRGGNNFDNWPQTNQRTKYTVDTSKLKAATNSNKNLSNIKLGPPSTAWNQGSGAKPSSLNIANAINQTITNNMYSVLENANTDPSILRGSKDHSSNYHSKGSSIDKSTSSSRNEYSSSSKSSSSAQLSRSNSSCRSGSERQDAPPSTAPLGTVSPPTDLTEAEQRLLQSILDLHLHNPNDEEFAHQFKEKFKTSLHSRVICELYMYTLNKPSKTYRQIANTIHYTVQTQAVSRIHFIIGFSELLELAPDLLIDHPKIYEYLAIFVVPFLVSKQITLYSLQDAAEKIISEKQGYLFLRSVLQEYESVEGPSSAKAKWMESGCYLQDWMSDDEAQQFRRHKCLGFLLEDDIPGYKKEREPSPADIQDNLLLLMNLDRSCECVRNYIQEFVGKATNEDWFMRALIQSVCEHALFGRIGEGVRVTPRLNVDRMSKYIHLVNEFGDDKEKRDASCLYGIQQLLLRLEHPKGVTLEIFQYLSDHYIIQREGFLAFEKSDQEPEGKGVLLKALVSFYTNIQEVDNEDSCSED